MAEKWQSHASLTPLQFKQVEKNIADSVDTFQQVAD